MVDVCVVYGIDVMVVCLVYVVLVDVDIVVMIMLSCVLFVYVEDLYFGLYVMVMGLDVDYKIEFVLLVFGVVCYFCDWL